MKRREFIRNTAFASTAGLAHFANREIDRKTHSTASIDSLPKQGPKTVVKGKKAVCSSSHPIVTETMKQVMKDGGNAMDAALAGSLVSATVQPHLTGHAGTVTLLYWEAKTGRAYQLDSLGTIAQGLPPFRSLPSGLGGFTVNPPMACIPGFMPGLDEMHRRFGSKPWAYLVEPSIKWAEEGFPVSSFAFSVLEYELLANTYFPSGRELFTSNGFTPQVGERFKNPKLAKTLKRLSQEGPEYFTKGDWAKHFVEKANSLGWPIEMKHMTEIPPRWLEPLRYKHNEYEILQLNLPGRIGVYSALVLGIMSNFNLKSMGHYSESAETLYYLALALRRAYGELELAKDPKIGGAPVEIWLSHDYHKMIADILKKSRPNIDLSDHARLMSGRPAMVAAGLPTAGPSEDRPPTGSCELSVVDSEGNWVQTMNTLQSGGIPGVVVDGVSMLGSHFSPAMGDLSGWLVGEGRICHAIGNTIVLKEGQPWLALGTPGNVHITTPQMLTSILDFDMDPYEASVAPRMQPMSGDYVVEIESRIPESVVSGLAKLGVRICPRPMYDYHMGSFQICWRDKETGLLNSSTDPRRTGKADGF